MKNLNDVMADTAAQQSHPFMVEIHSSEPGGTRTSRFGDMAMTALVLADWARSKGRDARVYRGGRLLWPRPAE